MPRIALGLEYDGTDFVGWQIQRAGRSVEAELGRGRAGGRRRAGDVHGAGRTDAGVHALQQVAHFDTARERTQRQWLLGINSNLPADVAVRWVREVPAEFDARRSALQPPVSLLDSAAADATRARSRARLVDPRAARLRRDDGRVAALARRARLLRVSRRRLSGEIAAAPDAGRADCARRSAPACSWSSSSRPMRFCNTWCGTSSATLVGDRPRRRCRPAAAARDAREPRPHAAGGGGAARGAHVARGVVSAALRGFPSARGRRLMPRQGAFGYDSPVQRVGALSV